MAFQALFTAAPGLNFAAEFGKAVEHVKDFRLLYIDYKEKCAMDSTIERMVSDYYGYIFGGYVRDMIAGIKRSDIDIRFPRRSDIDEFFLDLSKTFIVSPIDKSNKRMYNLLLNPVVHLVVVDPDAPDRFVYLDITNDQDHVEMRYDFDVNTLSLKNGHIVYPPNWNYSPRAIASTKSMRESRNDHVQQKWSCNRTALREVRLHRPRDPVGSKHDTPHSQV